MYYLYAFTQIKISARVKTWHEESPFKNHSKFFFTFLLFVLAIFWMRCLASSVLFLLMSHRGDSGMKNQIGTLHVTELVFPQYRISKSISKDLNFFLIEMIGIIWFRLISNWFDTNQISKKRHSVRFHQFSVWFF